MADETTKINLVLQAEAELSKLRAAEMQILALIAAYKKLSDASAAASKAAEARSAVDRGGAGASPEQFRVAVADAKAELQQLEKLAKNVKLPDQAEALNKQIASLSDNVKALSDPNRGAGTIGKTLADGAVNAGKQVESLEGKLRSLQGVGGKEPKIGLIESAERNLRGLREVAGVSAPTPKASADRITEQAIERGESPRVAQARTNATRAAVAAAEAATTEATAKKETAKASKTVAEETGKSAKNAKAVAEQTTATTKAATKVAAQVSPKATPSEISASLGGPLRSLLSQASRDPMGPVNRPTRRELEGASNLPIANKLAGKTLAGGPGGDGGAGNALRALAVSAERASAALSRLASSTAGSAKAAVGGGGGAGGGAGAPAQPKSAIAQLQQEVEGNRQAAAALHKTLRQQEALSNPRYKQAVQERAAAQVTYSRSVNDVANSSNNASRSINGMARQQDAILGQVRNVLGMAAGYQVLQGIAGELSQIFGHLKGGIIGFNSMLEQAQVGFTTLFKNQEKQLLASGEGLTKQQTLLADIGGKIDYIRMGYTNAGAAADGMIETIREFANVTPFRFAELQESALRMRAFGFELDEVLRKNPKTKEFEGGIVSVGNAVSALGGGADAFRRITYALGQMKQAGRVYQNDMMQLANAGIGGYKYIADALKREITTDRSGSRDAVKKGYEKMFSELESNAIEAVRRLTTNGQISGEAASRAIIAGLERDFGGGMEAQAKTFQGAFSTVADTSQSLVADAFTPLYNSIRDTTYELGQFLQKDDVRKRALEFSKTIETVVNGLNSIGKVVQNVLVATFQDFTKAISAVTDQSKTLGQTGSTVFGGFFNGIYALTKLMENDLIRQMTLTIGLVKLLFAFQGSNPLLTQIMLVVTAVGILSEAYKSNFLGFADAVNNLTRLFMPMVRDIQQQIIPVLLDLGQTFSGVVYGTIIEGFRLIEPAITLVVRALSILLRFVQYFKAPLTALAIAFAGAFVFGKIVAGFALVNRSIQRMIMNLDLMAQKARAASQGLMMGGYGTNLVGGPIQMIGPAGASSPLVTGRSVLSGFANKSSAIGIAGFGLGMGMEAMGVHQDITQSVTNVSTALLGFSALKMLFPPGTLTAASNGIKMIASSVTTLVASNLPAAANGLKAMGLSATFVTKATAGITTFFTALAAGIRALFSVGGVIATLGAAAASGGAGLFPAFDPNVQGSLTSKDGPLAFLFADKHNRDAVRTQIYGQFDPRFGDAERAKYIPEDNGGFVNRDSAIYKIVNIEQALAEGQSLIEIFKTTDAMTQKLFLTYRSNLRAGVEEAERLARFGKAGVVNTKDMKAAMDLLVNSQKQATGNLDYLNWLLGVAKTQMGEMTSLVTQLAQGALEELLNPPTRTNPYTGLEEAGLTMEEVINMEKEMGFAQFENSQGLVKNFDEYRNLLDSILPITDKDLVNGQLSVKAVEERLKIEKERRRELEHIKAIAQAEYDLGLAQLSMYDESIDPLQRGVQMRQAQMKYTEDINKLQMEGIDIVLNEAKASKDWEKATKAAQRRLEDYKKGQQLIINEMKLMFDDYNKDIADILSNPKLTSAQRQDAVKKRLEQLYTDLEKQFGITKDMLNAQQTQMNSLIDSTLAQLGNPNIPDVNWGGEYANAMEVGGFGVLATYLKNKAVEVARLTSLVLAASNPEDAIKKITIQNRDAVYKLFRARIGAAQRALPGQKEGDGYIFSDTEINLRRKIDQFKGMTDFEMLLKTQNDIQRLLGKYGLARGGYTGAGQMHLVGEQGPELFIPRSNGMVLSNSISSKLMGMLSGGGMAMAGSNNVTINVNNPVIRNDNDIRKLANEISKAQASQFRVNGGRLS